MTKSLISKTESSIIYIPINNTILIIDDNLLAKRLEYEGFDVIISGR